MLMLLQAASQLPPINFIMQQPAGHSEWAKGMISTGVGALFGIAGNIQWSL